LIDLCYSIFIYLAHAACMLVGLEPHDYKILQEFAKEVEKLDEKCRVFSVAVDLVEGGLKEQE
jgi:hypothetical protein